MTWWLAKAPVLIGGAGKLCSSLPQAAQHTSILSFSQTSHFLSSNSLKDDDDDDIRTIAVSVLSGVPSVELDCSSPTDPNMRGGQDQKNQNNNY
jgi:hypothetical protein